MAVDREKDALKVIRSGKEGKRRQGKTEDLRKNTNCYMSEEEEKGRLKLTKAGLEDRLRLTRRSVTKGEVIEPSLEMMVVKPRACSRTSVGRSSTV